MEINKKINKDRIVAGVLLLLALAFAIGALMLPETAAADAKGPKLYPFGLAILLAVLSTILMISGKEGGTKLNRKIFLQGFFPIIGICILYVVLLSKLGFLLCTVGLMLAFFWMRGERKWWLNLTIATGFTVVIYMVFGKLLHVPLKLMPFGIKIEKLIPWL